MIRQLPISRQADRAVSVLTFGADLEQSIKSRQHTLCALTSYNLAFRASLLNEMNTPYRFRLGNFLPRKRSSSSDLANSFQIFFRLSLPIGCSKLDASVSRW